MAPPAPPGCGPSSPPEVWRVLTCQKPGPKPKPGPGRRDSKGMAVNTAGSAMLSQTELRLDALSNRLSGLHEGLRSAERAPSQPTTDQYADDELEGVRAEIRQLRSEMSSTAAATGPERPATAAEVMARIGKEHDTRALSETELLNGVEEMGAALRLEIAKERRLRDESDERLGREACADVARLAAAINEEHAQRDLQEQRLEQLVADHVREHAKALAEEREARESSHGVLLSMLEEVAAGAREEIAAERARREAMEARLMRALEQLGVRPEP